MRIVSVLSCKEKHQVFRQANQGKQQQFIADDFDVSLGTIQRVMAEMRQYQGKTQAEYNAGCLAPKLEIRVTPNNVKEYTYQDIRDCKLYKENEWRFAAYEVKYGKISGFNNFAELLMDAIQSKGGNPVNPVVTNLMYAFSWAYTTPGHTFWRNMYGLVKAEKIVPVVPAPVQKPLVVEPKLIKDFNYQDIRDCRLYKENEWRFAAYEAKHGKIVGVSNFAELLMTIIKQLPSCSLQYFNFGTRELKLAFSWHYSPQGINFWYNMNQLVKPTDWASKVEKVQAGSSPTASGTWWDQFADGKVKTRTIKAGYSIEPSDIKPVEEPVVKPAMQYVITPVNVLFLVDGKQYSADVSHKNFAAIVLAVTNNDAQRAVDLADVSTAIERYMAGHVKVEAGVVTYQGMAMHGGMTDRIIAAMTKGEKDKVSVLVAFFNNLMENPSRRAVNELFGFLEANDIEITDDGYFYAWKKVKDNYFDIYTGTMDNSPGKMVTVPRNQVDENSDVTCSQGLHVCSKSYLRHYGTRSGNKVVKCKVHPRDVVAIPKDYNNAKMRCAGYYVVEDVTDSLVY